MLLEAVTPEVGKFITGDLEIPVYGIGAGPDCDGQLLIVSDVLGIWEAFTPKFVKKYANMAEESVKALQAYVGEVREGKFPTEEHCYKIIEGEAEKLMELVKQE